MKAKLNLPPIDHAKLAYGLREAADGLWRAIQAVGPDSDEGRVLRAQWSQLVDKAEACEAAAKREAGKARR